MDIRDCIDILKERKGGCEAHTRGFLNEMPAVPEVVPDHISSQSSIDLVNLVLSLQGERVQVC